MTLTRTLLGVVRSSKLYRKLRAESTEKRVAIACQGGGSHTAFTAGALQHLLDELPDEYSVCGLSGTSGGAVCATAAWYGLLSDTDNPGSVLEGVWSDLVADSLWERWINSWVVARESFGHLGMPQGDVSPYRTPTSSVARRQLRDVLETHVDFDALPSVYERATDPPRLFVGAADVIGGDFRTFADMEVTADSVLASAAIPPLFESVEIDGSPYWDGLYSQNPPIQEFIIDMETQVPDELWVIRINPQTYPSNPTSLSDIRTRMNQLVGNLSLNHQLGFVETVDRWIDAGYLSDEIPNPTVRFMQLPRTTAGEVSKLDRSMTVVESLMAAGRGEAQALLERIETNT
jgi:NTE family protein